MVSRAVASAGVVTAPASVVATEEAELATRASGTIRRMAVEIGARVRTGDVLATLDTRDVDARISSARAAEQLARQYHHRIMSIAVDGAATQQELDEAAARLAMAQAALRDASAQRDYLILRAPFSGVISARMADPGDLALPGHPILKLIATSALKVEADLPAEWAGRVSVGEPISVSWSGGAERYTARVTRAVPAVEQASRRFRIEAHFAKDAGTLPEIPPGTFVRIELPEPTTTTRWMPADALVSRGQLNGVFVVEGDALRLRWVRLGQRLAGALELLAGPGSEALLVREPAVELVDGQPVGEVRQVEWLPSFLDVRIAGAEESR